jgi:hypothetical protein
MQRLAAGHKEVADDLYLSVSLLPCHEIYIRVLSLCLPEGKSLHAIVEMTRGLSRRCWGFCDIDLACLGRPRPDRTVTTPVLEG